MTREELEQRIRDCRIEIDAYEQAKQSLYRQMHGYEKQLEKMDRRGE